MDRRRAGEAAKVLGFDADVVVHPLGHGQFCTAFLIDGDTVVRFPKHEVGRQALVLERQLVAALQGHVAVRLPVPLQGVTIVNPFAD